MAPKTQRLDFEGDLITSWGSGKDVSFQVSGHRIDKKGNWVNVEVTIRLERGDMACIAREVWNRLNREQRALDNLKRSMREGEAA